ncbi:beta-lactamase family protein [Burkholderia sp. AU30198]|uniref:serine hydrolase domain-containing protein n=1 Tax=Burkholderia sp. AU30198 TaxID=2879627 RepID=UPI001CF177CE|nr:serine hydrolase [Burkholderia sp. AU30198]MCA8295961.1 beta-lactamase family protein [Burkholderia sp. AU30198]
MHVRTRSVAIFCAVAVAAISALSGCGSEDSGSSTVAPLVLPNPENMFSWSTQEKVIGFSHSADLFSTESFRHGGNVLPLPAASGDLQTRAQAVTYQYGHNADGTPKRNTVDDYMAHNQATGLLVIKNGAVVLEKYAMGIDSTTVWDGKSVSKSVTSTLLGAAIKDGYIASLDDPVEKYVPELNGSAYQGVSLRNMLRMASGVVWDENYLHPNADVVALLRCQSGSSDVPTCILNHMKTLPRAVDPATGQPAVPGAVFNYSTGEAYLSGLVVQRATGRTLAKYLEQKIWQPWGMEGDGNWWTWNGVSFGGGGFNATLRDFGRFGLFVLNNGVLSDGTAVLPDNWVRDATTWTSASAAPSYADNGQYGYMWWFVPSYDDGVHQPAPMYADIGAPLQNTTNPSGAVPVQGRAPVQGQLGSVSDWTFAAIGIYGQMIAINQKEKLVVVQWSVWDKPDPSCCDASDVAYDASNPYDEKATFLNAMLVALH